MVAIETYQKKSYSVRKNPARTDMLTELPVYDIDLEEQVLAGLLHGQEIGEWVNKLTEDDFYPLIHKKIFKAIKHYYNKKGVFEFHNMPLVFKQNKDVLAIKSNIPLFSLMDSYVNRLKEITCRRELQYLTTEINLMVKSDKDFHAIRNYAENKLEKIASISMTHFVTQNSQVEEEFLEMLNRKIIPISTGFRLLDEEIGGLYPGYFVVIGGIPGVGKTTFMLNMLLSACQQDKRVLFVSLEMPYVETHAKLVSCVTGVPLSVLRGIDENTDMQKVMSGLAQISEYKLYRIGETETTVYDIESVVKKINGVDIIFIDYLQRVCPIDTRGSRYEQVSEIARSLKMLANKLKIPVISIVSINRGYENRTDHRPRLADFRDSGNIEYDVDIGLMLHRPAMFPNPDLSDEEFIALFDVTELQVVKNRYGRTGAIIKMQYQPEKSLFIERGYTDEHI